VAGADVTSDAHRRRHLARFDVLLAEQRARIDWRAEQLASERVRGLRELLSVARARSAWHRQRLAHVDLDHLSEVDLTDLPTMTKTDLMDNFGDIVTDSRLNREVCERHLEAQTADPYLMGKYHVVASAGSSGQRGVFVYGWDAWASCYASIVRFQERDWQSDPALAGVPRVIAVVGAAKPTHISAAVGRTFSSPKNPRHLFPVTQPLEQIVEGLNNLQPTVLMGYSSFLPRLALEATDRRLRISPRRVIAISEPLLPEGRVALEEAWGAPVATGYGMSEGVFAGACGHGLHLPDDLCLVEPVDAAGRPVAPRQASQRIYVTNLYNLALPLIRFEVTDELTVLDEPCPCGCAMRRIADPRGPLDDVFSYGQGVTVHPHVFRTALAEHPQVIEYQVRQTQSGADVRVVADGEIDLAAIERQLAANLVALGLTEPDITVIRAESLRRQESGKLKRFLPLEP
jgi:phenylacetate-coenzyme A ligase PaaK-like adenylate-forming protein